MVLYTTQNSAESTKANWNSTLSRSRLLDMDQGGRWLFQTSASTCSTTAYPKVMEICTWDILLMISTTRQMRSPFTSGEPVVTFTLVHFSMACSMDSVCSSTRKKRVDLLAHLNLGIETVLVSTREIRISILVNTTRIRAMALVFIKLKIALSPRKDTLANGTKAHSTVGAFSPNRKSLNTSASSSRIRDMATVSLSHWKTTKILFKHGRMIR